MNKMVIRWVSIFISLSFFIAILPSYASPALPVPVGKVIWVKGTFKATMPNKEVRILQAGSIINLNDTLSTDASSNAEIAFTDNSIMTFKANTVFYIDQYEYQPASGGTSKIKSAGKYVMNLIEGGFRTITGLIAKNSADNYLINTPVATIGVRGTDYAIALEGGQLYVNYYSGTPCVSSGGGTLCLSQNLKYANVPAKGVIPVGLKVQPTVFKETLKITPAKITPFPTAPGGTGGGPGGANPSGGGGTTTTPAGKGTGGVISSFCIS